MAWTNPTGSRASFPQFSGFGHGGGLTLPEVAGRRVGGPYGGSGGQQFGQGLQDVFQTITQIMAQRKKDEMANQLMEQLAPSLGVDPANNPFSGKGEQGLAAAMQMFKVREAAADAQRYPTTIDGQQVPLTGAQLAQYSLGRARTGEGGLTPYQQQMMQEREDRRAESQSNREEATSERRDARDQARLDRLSRRRSELIFQSNQERADNITKGVNDPAFRNKPFSASAELDAINAELNKADRPQEPVSQPDYSNSIPTSDTGPVEQVGPKIGAHPQDSVAVAWAKAHPDDPRSAKILQLNR
jgi:hypothetical protein